MLPTHHNELAAPEAPRRRFRKLRIAWSVVWGILCLLLIVLWARSYFYTQGVEYGGQTITIEFYAHWGQFQIIHMGPVDGRPPWRLVLDPILPEDETRLGRGFMWFWPTVVQVPCWCAVIVSAALAAIPWIRWSKQFRIDTMLIVTTLVAIVMGFVAYSLGN